MRAFTFLLCLALAVAVANAMPGRKNKKDKMCVNPDDDEDFAALESCTCISEDENIDGLDCFSDDRRPKRNCGKHEMDPVCPDDYNLVVRRKACVNPDDETDTIAAESCTCDNGDDCFTNKRNCDKEDMTFVCPDEYEVKQEPEPLLSCSNDKEISCTCDNDDEEDCTAYLPPHFTGLDNRRGGIRRKRAPCKIDEQIWTCGDDEDVEPEWIARPKELPIMCVDDEEEEVGTATCECRTSGDDCYEEDGDEVPNCLPTEFVLECDEGEVAKPKRKGGKGKGGKRDKEDGDKRRGGNKRKGSNNRDRDEDEDEEDQRRGGNKKRGNGDFN